MVGSDDNGNDGMKRSGFFAPFRRDYDWPLTRFQIVYCLCSGAVLLIVLL